MSETTLTFIGTDTCVPQPDDDTASSILGLDVCLCHGCLL